MNQILPKIIFLLLAFTQTAYSQDWVLKSEKKGVKVYHRETSGVHQLKLSTTLKTRVSSIIQLFSEIEGYTSWGYKISESRLIKRISPTELYYYSKVDFPWPLSDRDLVMRSTVSQDSRTKVVNAISVAYPEFIPKVKDVVRMSQATTRWVLMPQANGDVAVEYYIHSDPGGNIPSWMVNMALDVGPIETIERMRKILQEPRFVNAKLAHIRD